MDVKKLIELQHKEIVEKLNAEITEAEYESQYESGRNNQYACAYLDGRADALRFAKELLEEWGY